jgi:pimeloyl-ACP methyl ester carboxylesterase
MPRVYVQSWGEGRPLIALHGLGLESSCFEGLGQALAPHGIRTLSADLPGFGRTPAPQGPLTLRSLAEPVIDFAADLEEPPLLLGMSLGGRVALEAALRAPDVFRGVVLVAPALPRRYFRVGAWGAAWWLNPGLAERLPVEVVWPLLKRLAERGDADPGIEADWLTRAGKRAIYYFSCPATRAAFVGAIHAMVTDPTRGPDSLWRRLPGLVPPAAFVWGSRDRMVSPKLERAVARRLAGAVQLRVPCAGHYYNGAHFRCHLAAMAEAAVCVDARSSGSPGERSARGEVRTTACVVGAESADLHAGSPVTP